MKPQNNAGHGDPDGVPKDKITETLEAMLTAAKAIGNDGKGDGKRAGYFEALAVKEPKSFIGLLGRLLSFREPEVNEKRNMIIHVYPEEIEQ